MKELSMAKLFAIARRCAALYFVLFATATRAQERLPRIDPAGIGGSLIVSGAKLPQEALDVFFQLAKGESAKIVVLSLDQEEATKTMNKKLLEEWNKSASAELQLVRMKDDDRFADADWTKLLADATGVWISVTRADRYKAFAQNDVASRSLAKFVAKGNVIGIAGDGGAMVAEFAFAGEEERILSDGVLSLLPESIIDLHAENLDGPSRLEKLIEQRPHCVGYELDAGAAMIVQGRLIWKVGPGDVRIRRYAGQSESPIEIMLSSERDAADLVALRRAARDCIAGYPAQAKPSAAKVDRGTLIIIGGAGMPAGIMQRFVDLAGSKQSHIVVLPTAVPDPVDDEASIAGAFTKLGAGTVTVLPGRTLDQVESEEYLSALKRATGIWFGGGRQWRFVDAYLDTKAHALMHDVLRRGGVIMGSSAGASIQAEFLARGNPLGNLDIMADGYQRGLGFLPGAAIDQHFSQRNRQRDMLALVQRYPAWLGVGIDESTALIVHGEVGEVAGRGQVYFFDATSGGNEITPVVVAAGQQYDMTRRIAIRPPVPPDA